MTISLRDAHAISKHYAEEMAFETDDETEIKPPPYVSNLDRYYTLPRIARGQIRPLSQSSRRLAGLEDPTPPSRPPTAERPRPLTERVWRYLRRFGPCSRRELSYGLDATPDRITKALKNLQSAGRASCAASAGSRGALWTGIGKDG